jgi:hypothetical protein
VKTQRCEIVWCVCAAGLTALHAALEIAARENTVGKLIVVILADTASGM